jgi:hypothetical protein
LDHFSAEQWFEFAANIVSAEQKALMQRHLEKGCDECRRLTGMWRDLIDIGRRELNYHPPADSVRTAKIAFVSTERWKWLPQIATLARLIFDSSQSPAAAAMRGSTVSDRQFLQEAKPYLVDVRLECESARKWVHLTGQVLNSEEPDRNVADVEVFLLKGEHLATKTKANASGEFSLEFKDEEDLHLFVDIRGKQVIEIHLPTSRINGHGRAAGAE